ncbi:acyltransferase [Salmonella enterica subsp. enterica]|nr:acyltransferase [Salmonella enterica subsp. enterica]
MNNKFLFAHYLRGGAAFLRGGAALCVLFSHYTASFFISNDFISSVLNIPKAKNLSFPRIILDFIPVEFPGFLSIFGVATFFLISGFLIPISIEKYTVTTFLKKRFFRLYPTYFIVCIINLFFVFLGFCIFHYSGKDYHYGLDKILSIFSMGLSQYVKDTISMDPVAWTLAIEVLFYLSTLFFFRISFLFRRKEKISLSDVLLLSLILSVSVVWLSHHIDKVSVFLKVINVGFLIKAIYLTTFMLVGTTFSLYARGRIDIKRLVFAVILQFYMFVYITMHLAGPAFYISTVTTFSWFGLAIVVFAFLYAINDKISYNKSLKLLGDISYPLYLCHSYAGYFIIGMMINLNILPRSLVVFMPLPFVLILAYFIHAKVENKFVS